MRCKKKSQLFRTPKLDTDFLWHGDKLGKKGADFVEAWIVNLMDS